MENIRDEMQFITALAKGIAAHFGEKCEIVFHDLTEDYDNTIVVIENGHVTNRRVGDCGSNLGLEVLRGTDVKDHRYNYITQTKDGRILRSTSIYFKNKDGKVIGACCINLDITEFVMAENTLKSITKFNIDHEVKETFVNDVNDLLDYLLQECQNIIGKPVSHMTKEDKQKAVEILDMKGAFLIKKAGDKVCQFLDISKFTLYNLLEACRSEQKAELNKRTIY